MLRCILIPILFLSFATHALSSHGTTLTYDAETGYGFLVDGRDFEVKGVAGVDYLEKLKAYGGNTIRTWSIDKKLLDEAHALGLKVVAGIWIEHMRHGYDYEADDFIKKQRLKVKKIVRRYKDHPALLAWGLGNEVELHVPENLLPTVWGEMNTLAKIVKSIDPHHPIMTAVAGFDANKLEMIDRYYPEIDILGVNAYGFSQIVGNLLKDYRWEKPYMITEFGPIGHWEVGNNKSEWGVPLEESSHEKAQRYLTAHVNAMDVAYRHCVGTFPFLWGHKQEITTTWFGMFLPNQARLEPVDAMAYAWKGRYPTNRVPEIHSLESSARLKRVSGGSVHFANVEVIDHEKDPLSYRWEIMEESQANTVGGDYEEMPSTFPRLILENNGAELKFKAPKKSGAYRLFVYVEDDNQGAATANFPFFVN